MVIGAITISLLFDPNDYKDTMTAEVKARTGRTLTIGDDISLTFFPWLGVKTGNATFSNAPGFGDEPFATLDNVDVRVRLTPLLQKRVEAGKIILEGVHVNLAVDKEGRGNWEDLLTEKEAPPAQPDATGPQVAVAGLELRDATISWRDEQTQTRYVAEKISLETGELEPGKPIDVALALTLAEGLPGYVADLKLNGTIDADLEQSVYRIDDLELGYAVQNAKQEPQVSGTLRGKLAADVARSTYKLDDVVLEAQLPARGDGAPLPITASWNTLSIDQAAQTLSVAGLGAKAMDIEAKVTKLEGTKIIDAPHVTGTLEVPPVPVSRLLAAAEVTLPAGVDARSLGNASLRTQFVAEPSSGGFQVTGLEAQALGMRMQGDARAENGALRGNLRIPQFATADLFRVFASSLPADLNVKAIDKLALSTAYTLDTDKKTLALSDLKADLLGTSLLADIRVADFGGKASRYTGSVRVDRLEAASFLALAGKLAPAGLDAKKLGPVSLNTRFDMQSAQHRLQLDDLKMTLVGLDFSGAMALSKFPEATEYDGTVAVARFSPRNLLERFGAEVPVTADPKALTAATVKAHLIANPTLGRFEDVDLVLDDSRIRGSFAVKDFAKPSYEFDISIDQVDVDRYLPPPTPEEQAEAKKPAKTGDVKIPVKALKTLAIAGRLKADSMKLGGIQLTKLDATLDAHGGLAKLEPVSAQLYKGTFTGGFTADARAETPKMTIKGKAADIAVGQFLRDLSPEPPALNGQGSFNLELTGQGASYKKNMRSANGKVSFQLKDGALKGFDAGYTLCSTWNTLARAGAPKGKDKGNTPFEQISGSADVQQGVATTKDFSGSTDFMNVKGGGTLHLLQQKVDYDVDATMTKPVPIQGCGETKSLVGIPFAIEISGTVTEPKVMPDFSKIAKNVVQKKVEDELKDKLLDVLGDKVQPQQPAKPKPKAKPKQP
jgi:uncharacterized protein involved in outer membrane biogenesis